MCFECAIGYSLLALIFVCYIIRHITRNVNWAMHGHYLRRLLKIKKRGY